jgi:hypothetical protein
MAERISFVKQTLAAFAGKSDETSRAASGDLPSSYNPEQSNKVFRNSVFGIPMHLSFDMPAVIS